MTIVAEPENTVVSTWGSLTTLALERVSTACAERLVSDPAAGPVAEELQQRVSMISNPATGNKENLVTHLMSLTQAADALRTYSESHDPSDLEFSRALLAGCN